MVMMVGVFDCPETVDQRVDESVDPAPEIDFQIEPGAMAVQRVDADRLGIDHDFTIVEFHKKFTKNLCL